MYFEEVIWLYIRVSGDLMAEGTNIFFINRVEDKVAEGSDGGLVFNKLVLIKGELTGDFDLGFVGGSVASIETWVGGNDEGDIIRYFVVFRRRND